MKSITVKSLPKDKQEDGRRSSKFSMADGKARHSRRISSVSLYHGNQSMAWRSDGKGGFKMPKYQNTYRLEPYVLFKCEVSDKILAQIMTAKLKDVLYDPQTCPDLCKTISREICDKLYKTNYERVKYAVMITIIENADQSFAIHNGRIWDGERDTYSVFVYDNPSLYAVGLVMVTNYE